MKQQTPHILVIGSGWAGIAAAVHGIGSGARVTVVEERGYVGGRARSFEESITGEEIDNGQHLMMGCYHTFLETVRHLGTQQLLNWQRALRVEFVDANGGVSVLDSSKAPGKLGVLLGLLSLDNVSVTERLHAVYLAASLQWQREVPRNISCYDWLQQQKQSTTMITRFWEPVVLATLNAPIKTAPARLLVTVLKLAFFGTGKSSSLVVPAGGLSTLVQPFSTYLQKVGGELMLHTSVERLVSEAGRVKSVELSNGSVLEVDGAVSSIPQRALVRLLQASTIDVPKPLTQTVAYSPIVSVYMWFSENWMQQQFVAMLGTTIQWVFNRRKLASTPLEISSKYPGHIALTISAASPIVSQTSEQILAHCEAELRAAFREMNGATVLHGIVIKEKQATPLFTAENQQQRVGCGLLQQELANLTIAGDWTQTGLPATIEGAAVSGQVAMQRLLQ